MSTDNFPDGRLPRLVATAKALGEMTVATTDALDAIIDAAIAHKQPDEVLNWGTDAWMFCGCGESIKLPIVDRVIPGDAIKDRFAQHLRQVFLDAMAPASQQGGAA